MMKWQWMGIVALFVTSAAGAFDDADSRALMKSCMANVKNECAQWAAEGGGSGNPRGLTNELAVELAMGEKYMIYGTVIISRNQALLEIDFKEHPWLKTRRRAQNPYYRVEAPDLEVWRRLNRKYVSFAATAQGAIFIDSEGRKAFDIVLHPTSAPVLNGLRGLGNQRPAR